jgi:hypothetical protein
LASGRDQHALAEITSHQHERVQIGAALDPFGDGVAAEMGPPRSALADPY